ncbi:hypothetical protein JCM10908_004750 [Rhodotorula pacifica]|uniref:uncharacterized protein n=1 Tax=Rhodotorula pacifica TaxID=1495444 RepID=UPI003179C9BF
MSSTDDFDREVKALVTRGKLSSSAVTSLTELAMANIRADSQLVSTLYRHHRKASPANKLVSLYLIDAIAREAKSRQKKAEKEGKQGAAGPAAGSTTPLDSPPGAAAGPSAGDSDFASFLRKLEAVLSKIVLDNWENGLPEHKEKVRKVLDIWTRASTFGASALAKISYKLLAVSAAAPVAQMSPGRPSLSPGPADTPPRELSTQAPPAAPAIPANVLALLQAKAPPSQAALEQKKHDDVESEVERALREAREGISLALASAESASAAPTPTGPSEAPYSAPPASSASLSHGQSYGATSAYASSLEPAYPQSGSPRSGYDDRRPGPSHRVVSGGYEQRYSESYRDNSTGYGSSADPSYQSSHQQQQYGHTQGTSAYGDSSRSNDFVSHERQHSSGRRDDERGLGPRSGGGSDYRPQPSHQQQQSYNDSYGGGGGHRGQTRSFDVAQGGDDYGASSASSTVYGRLEEPPAKRPYQRDVSSSSLAGQMGGYGQPVSSFSGDSTPHQPVPPAMSGYRSNGHGQDTPASTASTEGQLDPTVFDATSPASWSTFVNLLRTSHPYFVSLGRMPTMEEVMGMCAPSAMMAFGSATGGVGMPGMAAMMPSPSLGMMGGGGGGTAMMPQGGMGTGAPYS